MLLAESEPRVSDLQMKLLGSGRGWLVFDKPAGLSVHNDPAGDALSLAQRELEASPELRESTSAEPDFPPAPVHRLDRETSGCLLFATRRDSARDLALIFQEHANILKIYRAILYGKPGNGVEGSRGEWHHELTDRAEGHRNIAGPKGQQKPCSTRYQILRSNDYFCEVEVELLTGRQHQIRRHAALDGHAVVGETRYAEARHARRIERIYGIGRLMLHAERLELQLPDQTEIRARAPIPETFAQIFLPAAGAGKRDS